MPIPPRIAKLLIRTGVAPKIPSVRKLMGEGVGFLKYYNRRVLGSPNVELRAAQALLDEAKDADVIDLSVGHPPIDGSFERLADMQGPMASGYPPVAGLPELRAVVAEKLRRQNRVVVDPDGEILICNGVSQGIGLALDAFVDPGERIAVFDPSFLIYRIAAENRGIRVAHIPTTMDHGRTRFRERDLRRALRGARILFVNTPANPTGGVLDAETLERIAWWCHRHDALIFSDEVYERFQYEGEHVSIGRFHKAEGRTITANSFSKSHGLAGLRVGYLAGHRYLIQPLIVTALAGAPFVSAPAQRLAIAAQNQPRAAMDATREALSARRQELSRRLTGAGLSHPMPAGAFFFWVSIRSLGTTGAEFARQLLRSRQVLVMPGESFGKQGRDYIRITYSGDGEHLREGVRRIVSFLAPRPSEARSFEPRVDASRGVRV